MSKSNSSNHWHCLDALGVSALLGIVKLAQNVAGKPSGRQKVKSNALELAVQTAAYE